MMAANSAVAEPTNATIISTFGASAYRNDRRAIMYTPAVTMVAAWISADTGVGPAIASGSHTYSGSCALLPQAPTKKHRPIQNAGVAPQNFAVSTASEVAANVDSPWYDSVFVK